MIMAENRCSKVQAFEILCHASNHRNEKIAFIAHELITRTAGLTVTTTHFDD
jgi:AmiR/NasT family two-component response regulator